MAYTLSRIDRKARTYELSATVLAEAAVIPPDLTGVDVALLPPRAAPTAATVWFPAEYADGSFTVLLAGPDADSTGALVVPASADLWMRIADTPEVDAEKLERITVLGGGAVLAAPVGVPVVTVNGKTGATIVLDADDVGAMAPGDGAGGALAGTYPNPGLNETAVDNAVAGKIATPGSATAAALVLTLGTEIAYAENITGVTTTLATGSLTDIPGTLITIPPTDRPVYLSAALTINGAAIPGTVSNNYLNGAIVEIGGGGLALGFNFPNGSIGAPHTVTSPAFRIGPTVTTRQFKLQAGFGAGGTVRNNAASPSFIQAFTR